MPPPRKRQATSPARPRAPPKPAINGKDGKEDAEEDDKESSSTITRAEFRRECGAGCFGILAFWIFTSLAHLVLGLFVPGLLDSFLFVALDILCAFNYSTNLIGLLFGIMLVDTYDLKPASIGNFIALYVLCFLVVSFTFGLGVLCILPGCCLGNQYQSCVDAAIHSLWVRYGVHHVPVPCTILCG